MRKSTLLAACAIMSVSTAISWSCPSYAQMAVADVPAETLLGAISGAITAGFAAVNLQLQAIGNAILSSSVTHQNVEAKLLTSHVQGLETFQMQGADAKLAGDYVRPPNACQFATPALAQAAAAAGVAAVNSALSNDTSVWMLGGPSANSGSGGVATSAILVGNHLARVANGGGAAPATLAAAQQSGLVVAPAGQTDATDWAVAPSNLFAVPTLDPADMVANSWTVDMQRLLGDPEPKPMPNPQTAKPEVVRKSLDHSAKVKAQELVLDQVIAERAPATANLHDWLAAVYRQQGKSTSSIPANVSWFQVHDTLVGSVLGGPQLDIYLSGSNSEATQKLIAMQNAEGLQLMWAIYQLLEKQGVQAGAAGARHIITLNK